MIYNLVSSGEIIARISEDYNINHADYINRVPQWIHQALNELNIDIAFIPKFQFIPIIENIGLLPGDIKMITGVEANGIRLNRIYGRSSIRTTEVNHQDAVVMTNLGSTIYGENITIDGSKVVMESNKVRTYNNETILTTKPSDKYNYILLPNGKIETNLDCEEVVVYYLSYPIEFDSIFGFEAPMIPDNEHVKIALTWYVLCKILMRGGVHPILKLGGIDPEYDPSKQWKHWKPIAINKANEDDPEQMAILSKVHRSFFYNHLFD